MQSVTRIETLICGIAQELIRYEPALRGPVKAADFLIRHACADHFGQATKG